MAITRRTTKTVTEHFGSDPGDNLAETQSNSGRALTPLDVKGISTITNGIQVDSSASEGEEATNQFIAPNHDRFKQEMNTWLWNNISRLILASATVILSICAFFYQLGKVENKIETAESDISELKIEDKNQNQRIIRIEERDAVRSSKR